MKLFRSLGGDNKNTLGTCHSRAGNQALPCQPSPNKELSRRKNQYRAKKRNQHPPSVSFGSARRIVLRRPHQHHFMAPTERAPARGSDQQWPTVRGRETASNERVGETAGSAIYRFWATRRRNKWREDKCSTARRRALKMRLSCANPCDSTWG